MNIDLCCLLVSDAAECASVLAALLAGHTGPVRIHVHGARPRDVAARLRERTTQVLLLDVDGIDEEVSAAYGRLQALAPALPVVLLASAATEAAALGVVRQGASDYLLREQLHAAYLASTLRHAVQLRQAYDQLTTFLDSLPDVAWLKDAKGRFAMVNRAYTRVVGQTAGEIIGRTTTELFPVEVAEGFRASDARALREGHYVVEEEVRHGDGTQRWYETTRAPIRGQDGAVAGLVGIAHDISNRRRMEQALRSTHDRLQGILAASPTVPYTLRISADGSDRSVWVSANVPMVLGYEEEETQQPEWWLAGIHPDDRMAVADWMDRLLKHGRLCHEYRFRHRDESYRWVRDDLTLMSRDAAGALEIVGTWTDITERKEAEFAVSRSRDYYHSLLDSLPSLVWRSDAEGACDYFNATWLEFTGRTLQEESGDGWLEGVHPEDRERCLAIYGAAVAACEPFEREYRLRHRGGEYRWVLDVGRPLYDGDGAFQGLIGGAIDLEAQRQLEAQLRMAQKMEAVGRLAGGVAHDFNNLLTAVTANAALLLQDLAIGDPARENVGEIADAAERAAALTRDLLAFSRKQVLQPRVLDLNEVLGRTHPMLRRLIGADVAVRVCLEPQLTRTRADPSQIEQVILNLAINARDSMPQGGELRFRTQNLVVGPESRPQPYVLPGRYVALVVEDTGFGMDEATRLNIFEPFFTTKPTGEGTGLGLSTAYGIVKQSDGYIWVQSEPGRGSTFTVLLPQAEVVPAAPVADASSAGSPLAGRETVLLVEDEALVRRAARRILQRGGYTVLEADSGEQALHLAREAVQPIHLLLTDVVMPALGGRELADQVVALHPRARVIYMSGYTRGAIAQRGVLEPGTILLEKPFAPEALTQMVRQVLDGSPHGPSR